MRLGSWVSSGEAIRAEELRLKATGLLVNKSHVMHEDVNAMNREQVCLEKLDEFRRMAERRMKNVTPASDDVVEIVEDSEKTRLSHITPFPRKRRGLRASGSGNCSGYRGSGCCSGPFCVLRLGNRGKLFGVRASGLPGDRG